MRWTLILFMLVCLAHLSEHIAQAVQIYAYNVPLQQAGGILGKFFPWLVHSETLHYGYALVMWVGLWHFRDHFAGPARVSWVVAFGIQTWHHLEHALLVSQVAAGQNLFGASQPISVMQFTGFLYGTPQDDFGGLLRMSHFGACTCQGAEPGTVHGFTWKLLTVRRVEVHLLYNLAVTLPMVVALLLASRAGFAGGCQSEPTPASDSTGNGEPGELLR